MERLREDARCNEVFLDVVEAAAVDLTRLASDAGLTFTLFSRWPEMVVERDEVERRSNPDDPGDDVQPPREQVEPVGDVWVEG